VGDMDIHNFVGCGSEMVPVSLAVQRAAVCYQIERECLTRMWAN